jgi:hypothetical protein
MANRDGDLDRTVDHSGPIPYFGLAGGQVVVEPGFQTSCGLVLYMSALIRT